MRSTCLANSSKDAGEKIYSTQWGLQLLAEGLDSTNSLIFPTKSDYLCSVPGEEEEIKERGSETEKKRWGNSGREK